MEELREARADEAEAVAALVQSAYRGEASRAGWTTEADLVFGDRISPAEVTGLVGDPDVALLVLEDEEGLLACCSVSRAGAGRAAFGLFAVRPGAQGRGVGRRVMAGAIALSRERFEAATLAIEVLEPRTELIGWYERLGFRRTGAVTPFGALVGTEEPTLVDGLRFVALELPTGSLPTA